MLSTHAMAAAGKEEGVAEKEGFALGVRKKVDCILAAHWKTDDLECEMKIVYKEKHKHNKDKDKVKD